MAAGPVVCEESLLSRALPISPECLFLAASCGVAGIVKVDTDAGEDRQASCNTGDFDFHAHG
eukprot:6181410-Pleurochrysis_carterae.AAC.1